MFCTEWNISENFDRNGRSVAPRDRPRLRWLKVGIVNRNIDFGRKADRLFRKFTILSPPRRALEHPMGLVKCCHLLLAHGVPGETVEKGDMDWQEV